METPFRHMPVSNFSRLLRHLQGWRYYPRAMLVYVDVRHLRTVNRIAGTAAGDGVILKVGLAMKRWAGAGGCSERLWSNEFVAVKAIDHGQSAVDEAQALREALSAIRYASPLGENRIAVSIGLIALAAEARWGEAIGEAAEACLAAKRRGLNQIVTHAPQPEAAAQVNAAHVLSLRRMIEQRQVQLHPQPIMDISRARPRLAKAEFLLRAETGGGYAPLPAGTIETMEYFGLAPELDAFSAQQFLDWVLAHPAVVDRLDSLSMNLSAKSIVDGAFMDSLLRDVRSLGLPRGKLCFEITETAAVEQLEVAADVIDAFRAIGCKFALDDFGSGLCSFGYLHSLPVDEVKIDGRFVRDLAQSPVSREIVRAIHQVARATGKKTVAEFVDDTRKLSELQSIGIDYAQGWLFHPAVTTQQFLELVKAPAH